MGKRKEFLTALVIILGSTLAGIAGWFAIYFNIEQYFLLLPVAILGFGIILYNPKIGIFLLLLLLAIVPPAPQEIGLIEIAYIAVFAITILAWLIRRGWEHLPFSYTYFPIIAILMIGLFSIVVAMNIKTSLYHWLRGIIPFIGLFLFFIAAGTIKTKKDRNVLIWVLYVTALLTVIVSFGGGIGMMGLAISANNFWILRANLGFGAYQPIIIGTALFAFGFILASSRKGLFLHYAMLLFSAFAAVMTFFRSVYLILFACVFFALVLYASVESINHSFRIIIRITAVLIVVGLIALVLFPSEQIFNFLTTGIIDRFLELSEQTIDENVRIKESREALSYFLSSPIFGKGLGFQYQYDRGRLIWKAGYTHNIFTYFAMTLGSLGLGSLVWFIISVYRDIRQKIYRWKLLDFEDRSFLMGAILYLLTLFLYVQFQSVFRHIGFFTSFCIMFGALVNIRDATDVSDS